jgi:hypothetical protein
MIVGSQEKRVGLPAFVGRVRRYAIARAEPPDSQLALNTAY